MAQDQSGRFRSISMIVCLVAAAFLIAHAINAFVADALMTIPPSHASSERKQSPGMGLPASYAPAQYAEDVRSSGLFALPPPKQETDQEREAAVLPIRASLGAAAKIRLIGIVMGERGGVFAIVEEQASKKQSLYRLHDRIPDVGEVADIRHDGLLIREGNLEELVELEMAEKPAASGAGAGPAIPAPAVRAAPSSIKKVIDRREVEAAMSDLSKLMTQARAVPHMVNGTINGFRIDYMAPASFYEKIGVQTGDILQRVNGVDIRDPSTILTLLQQLKHEEIVKLDLVRQNRHTTVTYELR